MAFVLRRGATILLLAEFITEKRPFAFVGAMYAPSRRSLAIVLVEEGYSQGDTVSRRYVQI